MLPAEGDDRLARCGVELVREHVAGQAEAIVGAAYVLSDLRAPRPGALEQDSPLLGDREGEDTDFVEPRSHLDAPIPDAHRRESTLVGAQRVTHATGRVAVN